MIFEVSARVAPGRSVNAVGNAVGATVARTTVVTGHRLHPKWFAADTQTQACTQTAPKP